MTPDQTQPTPPKKPLDPLVYVDHLRLNRIRCHYDHPLSAPLAGSNALWNANVEWYAGITKQINGFQIR